jgi:hypothetical protein
MIIIQLIYKKQLAFLTKKAKSMSRSLDKFQKGITTTSIQVDENNKQMTKAWKKECKVVKARSKVKGTMQLILHLLRCGS